MKKAFIVPLLFMLFVSQSDASSHTSVQKVRYSSFKSQTRVVIELSGPIVFTQQRISKPDRLFFDIENCTLSDKIKTSVPIMDGILKKVRMSQYKENTVRVVLDIDTLGKYSVFMLEDPDRLVIDMYPEIDDGSRKEAKGSPKLLPDKNLNKIETIVIDAGHGGKDPGAIGPAGLQEKDITLYVGKKLGEILEQKQGARIIYTRDKDIFVPLNDRTEMANTQKADLFVSIHVNASEQRQARGIETYFLNWTNDREALKVAARENQISINKMENVQDGLQIILQDLARNNKREESMKLAHSVQSAMVDTLRNDYSKVEDLGVKYALFYVLVGAEMPSILVEISFISNHEEEKRLAADSYRNKVAEAIAKGIDAYISQATLVVDSFQKHASGG